MNVLRLLATAGVTVGFLGTAIEANALCAILRERADLQHLAVGQDIPIEQRPGAAPPVQLARAIHLGSRQRYEDALAIYNWLAGHSNPSLRVLIAYDQGNLYLRRAVEHVERMEIFQAVPALELAKEAYRKALTADSNFWDAKYNLEVAMRLLPEMARRDLRSDEAEEDAETHRTWATLPGFPRGLP